MIREVSLLWTRFSPLESRLLSAIRAILPAAAVSAYDGQVAAINHVQRLPPSWSEIDLYSLARGRFLRLLGGKVTWLDVPKFPCTDEFRLAEVRFQVKGKLYKSTLSSIRGHIFDLMTTPGPRAIAFDPWDSEATARLLADPLRAPTGIQEAEAIPSKWHRFLQQHAGAQLADWSLYGAGTARRVALDDGVYLILAERQGADGPACILHRIEPPADDIFYLCEYGGTPERVAGELDTVMGAAEQGDAADKMERR